MMPVAPYGTPRYREWNRERMRRYRAEGYSVREAERAERRRATEEKVYRRIAETDGHPSQEAARWLLERRRK